MSDRETAEKIVEELLGGIDRWDGDPQAFIIARNTIAAALAAEREACAKVAEGYSSTWSLDEDQTCAKVIAAAIRARESQP